MDNNINEKFNLLQHLNRVSDLAYEVALEMGQSEMFAKEVAIAGHLHDVGKLIIHPEILNKQSKISNEEFSYLKKHVTYSSYLLDIFSDNLSNNIIDMVAQHHENADGTGYPKGLDSNDINLGASIIRVCDTYDAITNNRPYSNAEKSEEAIRIIESENNKYLYKCIKALKIVVRKEKKCNCTLDKLYA